MTANDSPPQFQKCPTGIPGLDEILNGGLPRGRPTLVCGTAGSGKTLLAMEFIVRGARDQREPGVFMCFEETEKELATNVASLGFNLPALSRKNLIAIDHVHLERSEIIDTGEYDLEGLFVRLDAMIKGIGAQRVAIDSLEALFASLPNEAILRAELRRLFRWLKERGVTAVITGEQGQGSLTRHGLEEYISDCVIFLDHRIVNQVATRRLRVVKYRGTVHGTSEYPTMIDERGLSVLPISSLGLDYPVTNERISSGVTELDRMLGDQGYFRGSSILVSGTAGTGKSSFAAAFIEGACERGERGLFLAFEEPSAQILRNMASIGYQLEKYLKKGLLHLHAARSTLYGLEQHLVAMHKMVERHQPDVIVFDPITNFKTMGDPADVKAMLTRVIDFLKQKGITAFFTNLTPGGASDETSEAEVSSLMDSWLLLRNVEMNGDRRRFVHILKSRGMAHSSEIRGFKLTPKGIEIHPLNAGVRSKEEKPHAEPC